MFDSLAAVMSAYPLPSYLLIVAASLVIMLKSADLAVSGISDYAKRLGVSDYLIGTVVIAIASSMPELMSSVTGQEAGESGIVFGTILGSNIVELTLVLGAIAFAGKKIRFESKVIEQTEYHVVVLAMLPFILMIDGVISRIDGLILVSAYFGYLFILWRKEGEAGRMKKDVKYNTLRRDILIFLGCTAALILSSRWLVFSSIGIAQIMNVSPFLVALVVIGITASLPDISVGVRSALSGHQDLGIGNIIGSNFTKALFFLGVLALIEPLRFPFQSIILLALFTLACTALVIWFMKKKLLTWKNGVLLYAVYILFLVMMWFFGNGIGIN
ncbi:sodium:calcium antiporter [Candidatus Woesearchaeota archaeon]|nr:sodium:calcium antiporter [Candidatus Woesearchaeota archaeon]